MVHVKCLKRVGILSMILVELGTCVTSEILHGKKKKPSVVNMQDFTLFATDLFFERSSLFYTDNVPIQWGLHLRIGSSSKPLMCISFHLLKNNDPKIAKLIVYNKYKPPLQNHLSKLSQK